MGSSYNIDLIFFLTFKETLAHQQTISPQFSLIAAV